MKVFKRTQSWTGPYLLPSGRLCQLVPEFMRTVGDQYVPIAYEDGVIEFHLKSWFAANARSV